MYPHKKPITEITMQEREKDQEESAAVLGFCSWPRRCRVREVAAVVRVCGLLHLGRGAEEAARGLKWRTQRGMLSCDEPPRQPSLACGLPPRRVMRCVGVMRPALSMLHSERRRLQADPQVP